MASAENLAGVLPSPGSRLVGWWTAAGAFHTWRRTSCLAVRGEEATSM